MASERTLIIIKPDATERNLTGHITARLEITPTYPAERITYNTTLTIDALKKLFE